MWYLWPQKKIGQQIFSLLFCCFIRSGIWDPGWIKNQYPGKGINIPDPQHWSMDKEKKVKDTCKFGSKLAMEKELGLLRIRNIQNFTSYDCLKIIETRRLHCLLSLFMRFTYCKLTAPCTDGFNITILCRCKVDVGTFGTDNNLFAPLHLNN